MSYTVTNFRSKKALKAAVADPAVTVRVQRDFIGPVSSTYTGRASIEGPHSPAPHSWYAQVQVTDGVVTKVLS
jgi:hypothetical protein